MNIRFAIVTATTLIATASAAQARPAATGFYAEGGLGGEGFLGAAAPNSAIGPELSLRIGHDLWSWLSIGIAASSASHQATLPSPPSGEWYQLDRGWVDVRAAVPVGAVALFIEGGAGAGYMSTNVLQKVGTLTPGQRWSPAFSGGAGIEYQTEGRHYAFGLAGDWTLLSSFHAGGTPAAPGGSLQGVEARLFIRYTY